MDERDITLRVDRRAKRWLGRQGYDRQCWLRHIWRVVQCYVENPLSRSILGGDYPSGSEVRVTVNENQLYFHLMESQATGTKEELAVS